MPKLASQKRLLAPKSLERVIALCGQSEGEDSDELNKALDVLVIAHAAATFQ
jgi:hypothetical protein